MNTNNMTDTMTNMFRQATESFQSAMETGCKMRQEAIEACTKPMMNDEMVTDMRDRTNKLMDNGMKLMQKSFEETQKFIDTTTRTNMDVCRKMFDAARPSDRNEVLETGKNMFQNTFDAMRNTVEQFTKCQMTGFDHWTTFMNQTMTCAAKNDKAMHGKPVVAAK